MMEERFKTCPVAKGYKLQARIDYDDDDDDDDNDER